MSVMAVLSDCITIHLSIIFVILILGFTNGEQSQPKCVKWGNTFDVPLNTKNVVLDCQKPDGRKVCCAAVEPFGRYQSQNSRGVGVDFSLKSAKIARENNKVASTVQDISCQITKQYVSSPLELRDIALSRSIENISDPDKKFDALLNYVTSDELTLISTRWLNRVTEHMKSADIPSETKDDREYLSYFLVTRICRRGVDDNAPVVERSSWKEWIEPITVHARHPFGFGRCRYSHAFLSCLFMCKLFIVSLVFIC